MAGQASLETLTNFLASPAAAPALANAVAMLTPQVKSLIGSQLSALLDKHAKAAAAPRSANTFPAQLPKLQSVPITTLGTKRERSTPLGFAPRPLSPSSSAELPGVRSTNTPARNPMRGSNRIPLRAPIHTVGSSRRNSSRRTRSGRPIGGVAASAPMALPARGSQDALAQQAIEEIKAMIASVPDGEELTGGTVVPPDWATRFKPTLGPYKRFVEQYPQEFVITMQETGNYFVTAAPTARSLSPARLAVAKATVNAIAKASQESNQASWAPDLRSAWQKYTAAVLPGAWDVNEFLSPLPDAAGASMTHLQMKVEEEQPTKDVIDMEPIAEMNEESRVDTPEAIRILQPKYGLQSGSIHKVVGSGKLQWKLANGYAVPFEQEGDGWERCSQEELDASLVEMGASSSSRTRYEPEVPQSPGPPWVVIEHPEHPGHYYYFNEITSESVWELPSARRWSQRTQRGSRSKRFRTR